MFGTGHHEHNPNCRCCPANFSARMSVLMRANFRIAPLEHLFHAGGIASQMT
jgi:hypothetical protein